MKNHLTMFLVCLALAAPASVAWVRTANPDNISYEDKSKPFFDLISISAPGNKAVFVTIACTTRPSFKHHKLEAPNYEITSELKESIKSKLGEVPPEFWRDLRMTILFVKNFANGAR
ncbi:MAG: hypothetical protein V4534_00940 [Myxococcota bacterium]